MIQPALGQAARLRALPNGLYKQRSAAKTCNFIPDHDLQAKDVTAKCRVEEAEIESGNLKVD